MRLLTDAATDADDDSTPRNKKTYAQKQRRQRGAIGGLAAAAAAAGASSVPAHDKSESSCEDSSMSSSSSPSQADYVFDMMYGNLPQQMDIKDIYDPLQQQPQQQSQQQHQQQYSLFGGGCGQDYLTTTTVAAAAAAGNGMHDFIPPPTFNMMEFDDTQFALTSSDPFMLSDTTVEEDIASMSTDRMQLPMGSVRQQGMKLPSSHQQQKRTASQPSLMYSCSSSTSSSTSLRQQSRALSAGDLNSVIKELESPPFPLWPNYLCLYLEYSLPYDPQTTVSHNLALLQHCYPNCLSTLDADTFDGSKCPPLVDMLKRNKQRQQQQQQGIVLLARTKLDLNLNISDFVFNNTCFFESRERRTIECTTTIYSFGNVVLESREIQQALWLNDRFMYSFVYVNQFFDAFMKGIRSLQSWEEVDIAIRNLCIVQVFEDIEVKYGHTTAFADQPWDQQNGSSSKQSTSSTPSPASQQQQQLQQQHAPPPLLTMVYEFERGHGNIDVSAVGDPETTSKLGIGRGFDLLGDM